MSYLDGELGAKMDRVGAHTKKCWSCRLRLEKIERAISEFMEARNSSFAGPPTFPTQLLAAFATRLDRLAGEHGTPKPSSGLIHEYARWLFPPRVSPRGAIFVASLGLMLLIIARLNWTQPVSAKEVLFQVRQAEARKMAQVPAPVIYEELQLRRHSRNRLETVTWEIWNDTANKRVRERVKNDQHEARSATGPEPAPTPALLEDFGEMYKDHQADPGRPLSPNNYEVWRASVPQESEEVLEGTLPNGDKATILKVSGRGPFPPDTIVGAEFTVRAADWHPVGQRLLVQKQGVVVDYSLGEVAFNVMSISAVPASIFAVGAPARARISYTPVRRILPVPVHIDERPAEADLLPGEAALTAAEVEARYALHSVGACIGRPISVRVGVGRIEVEGVVDTEERKEEILVTLRGIPYVAADIRTVAEVAAMAPPINEDTQIETSSAVDAPVETIAAKPKLAIEDLLRRYFTTSACASSQGEIQHACVENEIAGLSRQALAHSEAAQAQAWALRRLVEWGPFLGRGELRISSQRLLDLMVRDHMDALRSELEQWRARLKPVLSAVLDGDPAGYETQPIETAYQTGDWAATSLFRLCSAVEEAGNRTLGTLAETNRPVSEPAQAVKELLSELDGLNREFPKLEADVHEELSGGSKTALSSEKREQK